MVNKLNNITIWRASPALGSIVNENFHRRIIFFQVVNIFVRLQNSSTGYFGIKYVMIENQHTTLQNSNTCLHMF